uniref:Membrane-associated kinase regulator 2 n=2 Tax=Cajanus cajan TaxID=3821 RepID=A0A151SV41_CAJCA|nr:hypothetical protein KK1_014074 [Cajanus cajan]
MLGLKKPKPHDAEDKPTENVPSASEEKRFMRNYFKMVKPLYVRVSRAPNGNTQKQGTVPLPAALRKHFGKGPSPPLLTSKRRDDSLLHQHDWIQGAILHCKNSFNASTECESSELPRSVSDTSPEKCRNDKCL